MVKIIKFLVTSVMILMGAFGCCRELEPSAWVATRNISIYKDHAGDAQAVAFELDAGDICVPGRVETEKVFQYTEVLCPGKGYGWAATSYFKVINKKTINIESN